MNSPSGQCSSPVGQRVLQLKSIPTRLDIRLDCTLHDELGAQVGAIRQTSVSAKQVFDRTGVGGYMLYEFEVLDANGDSLGTLRKPAEHGLENREPRQFVFTDALTGEVVFIEEVKGKSTLKGLLNPMEFSLIRDGNILGATNDMGMRIEISDYANNIIARISRKFHNPYFFGPTFVDYTLSMERMADQTTEYLCLLTMFAEYFNFRTLNGGPFRQFST